MRERDAFLEKTGREMDQMQKLGKCAGVGRAGVKRKRNVVLPFFMGALAFMCCYPILFLVTGSLTIELTFF